MSEQVVDYGAVGWEPAIGEYKRAVEAAIAAQGVGYAMLPLYGKPPKNVALNASLPGFAYNVPTSFVPPQPPDGVFTMAQGVGQSLMAFLASGSEQ